LYYLFVYIFGTGIKQMAGEKAMVCGNMIKKKCIRKKNNFCCPKNTKYKSD
jgi:hypothetical protein